MTFKPHLSVYEYNYIGTQPYLSIYVLSGCFRTAKADLSDTEDTLWFTKSEMVTLVGPS